MWTTITIDPSSKFENPLTIRFSEPDKEGNFAYQVCTGGRCHGNGLRVARLDHPLMHFHQLQLVLAKEFPFQPSHRYLKAGSSLKA